jgi:hypothetical protein
MNEKPRVSPFCTALSSKKIMVAEGAPLVDEDVLDRSCHCWCAVTTQVLGPDRELASPADCRKGRACFRSPFEPLL